MIYKTLFCCVCLRWPGELHTYWTKLTQTAPHSPTPKISSLQNSKNVRRTPCVSRALTAICSNMYPMSLSSESPLHIPLQLLSLPGPPLPLTFPISQHSWAMPHHSKSQFIGLMLQWVQTGLWDRMFGWYLALLKQTSAQNMITGGKEGTVLLSYFNASRPH